LFFFPQGLVKSIQTNRLIRRFSILLSTYLSIFDGFQNVYD